MGWFFGFKLHIVINDKGEIIDFLFNQGNIDDRESLKNSLMQTSDRVLLRKRTLVETVNDELQNTCQIEHTRHRSVDNFLSNLISGLIAYHFLPKKPSLNLEVVDEKRVRKAA
ncbi:Transposase DDE domain protein [Salinivirga cyanobacteriivorans]|uniref:Transposase DDE domain protein n=1 Tax=Salinivirga cyanobacteriivorans TaxID=1307839 RepID=A0A0S2I5E3_9BACT|nr:Transposase DDE domain protein [Salinivirga cyanobacteriivorans]